jgi:DNA-binding GntR family transcriptional regulator
MTGSLQSGDRLIVERVAAQFGVSPTPVREAFARLIQEGIVDEVGPGRLRIVPLTEQYVLDTYAVRGALEGLAAEFATTRLAESDLEKLDALQGTAAAALAVDDLEGYASADRDLHRFILNAAQNSVLTRDLDALQSHIGYIRDYSHRHRGTHLHSACAEHPPLLAAFRRGDSAVARVLMESHIRNSAIRIAALIKTQDRPSED